MENQDNRRPVKWLKIKRSQIKLGTGVPEKKEPEYNYGSWHRWRTTVAEDGDQTIFAIVEREDNGQVIQIEATDVIFLSHEEQLAHTIEAVQEIYRKEEEEKRKAIESL